MLLAAGSGRRYGTPKALVDTGRGPWVRTSLEALQPCDVRLVVVGASAVAVSAALPDDVYAVANPEHRSGMGSSLRRALTVLMAAAGPVAADRDPAAEGDPGTASSVGFCDAVVIHLVDLPGVGAPVVRRLIDSAGSSPGARDALLRAGYDGVGGHPVLLGRHHWAAVAERAGGDTGARGYFRSHPPLVVECGDIGAGADIDEPPGGAAG